MRYLQPGIKYFLIRGTIWDVYEMYEIFAARYKIYFDVSYIIWDVQGRILHQNIITIYLQRYQIFSAVAQYGPFKAEYYIKILLQYI